MPAFVTHALFGERVKAAITDLEVKKAIETFPDAYFWGLQGPDLLFFRKAVSGRSELPAYGGRMHREQTDDLFYQMGRYIADLERLEEKMCIGSYMAGFICHYMLDCTTHPYVYFLQNREHATHPKRTPSNIHHRLESDIDSAIHRLWLKGSVRNYQVRGKNLPREATKMQIAKLYHFLLWRLYRIPVDTKEIEAAFADTLHLLALTVSKRSGVLEKMGLVGESLVGKKEDFTGHIRRANIREDILNNGHSMWNHPATPCQKSLKSFVDLAQEAQKESVIMLEQAVPQAMWGVLRQYSGLVCFDNGNVH